MYYLTIYPSIYLSIHPSCISLSVFTPSPQHTYILASKANIPPQGTGSEEADMSTHTSVIHDPHSRYTNAHTHTDTHTHTQTLTHTHTQTHTHTHTYRHTHMHAPPPHTHTRAATHALLSAAWARVIFPSGSHTSYYLSVTHRVNRTREGWEKKVHKVDK